MVDRRAPMSEAERRRQREEEERRLKEFMDANFSGASSPRAPSRAQPTGPGIIEDLGNLPPPNAPGALPFAGRSAQSRFGGGVVQPGGPEQPYPPGFEQRPPSLDQPTPNGMNDFLSGAGLRRSLSGVNDAIGGIYGNQGALASSGADAAVPGLSGAIGGLQAAGSALGGASSPSLAGPASFGTGNSRVDDIASGYAPTGGYSGGGGGAVTDPFAALTNFGRANEGVGEAMLNDPRVAVAGAFRALGIDPSSNRFAQMTINRYAPVLDSLAEVFSWVATGSPEGADPAAMMPEFLKHFMSGGDVRGLLTKAFDMAMAPGGEAMREGLVGAGAEQLAQLASATTGQGQLTQRAKARLLADRMQDRAIRELSNPNEADEGAFLQDIRRTYGL